MSNQSNYDVVIVGAGIAGALTAYKLAQAGKRVLILEAGPAVPPDRSGYMKRFFLADAKTPESPYPLIPNARRPLVLDLGAPLGTTDKGYFIQDGPLPFSSTYERVAGGTTWHWLGTSLRLLPNDFRLSSKYGRAVDWPIGYDDLEPWYGQAEAEIGVAGNRQDQSYLDLSFSQDYPMPGIVQSYLDQQVAAAIGEGFTYDGQPVKVSPTPQARNSRPYDGRRACAGNTNCIPICPIQAKYDATIHLARALQHGVEVRYQAVADTVTVDAETGRVSGITYKRYEEPAGPPTEVGTVTATLYVLAAHAVETPKLLLNSATDNLPNGVANRSGQVGRNLMDHPVQLSWAVMPKPVYPFRGPLSTSGIESLRDGPFRAQRSAFRMEIGNEGWNWAAGDPYTTVNDAINGGLSGKALPTGINQAVVSQMRFGSLVEQMPLSTNRVTPDRDHPDNLGIPRPRISYDLDEYTRAGFAAARDAAVRIFEQMGATDRTRVQTEIVYQGQTIPNPSVFRYGGGSGPDEQPYLLNGAGHLMGTYRMGSDPTTSVVTPQQKSHDHDNLYLLGSGVFPTVGTANPTLTIAALTLMAAQAMISELEKSGAPAAIQVPRIVGPEAPAPQAAG